MKYVIKETHITNLLNVFNRLMNSEEYKGVCNVMVDYDDTMDRFVLNIMFNKQYIISVGNGIIVTKYLKETIKKISEKFSSFTGFNPYTYQHYSDC